MSKEVDQKVVEMRFDNRQFEQNVKTTMSTLDRLKAALNFKGSVQGLESINNASKNNNVGLIGQAAEAVSVKFSAMEVVAMTALSNITNSVLNTGKHILNSLTFEPVMSGFKEYETQINAVQTILANTSMDGTGIEDVNAALDELNLYADKTIYNFTEMARNIGTFTAAGVKLEPAVEAIKGIANLAALSGSNSQQASTAMYQLSQALAAGRVSLQDWNSVVNAGMGGKVFQNALMDTAEAMGIVVDRTQSFRESLSTVGGKKSWLTSEVLLNTLRQFTGDLTDAELAQMGFNKAQIETIQNMAFTANEAATRVKTATQLYDTLKESVQSGWTQTWELIFGDFEEAKVFFTNISNILGDFFNQSAEARNRFVESIMSSPWDVFSKKLSQAGVDIEDFQKRAWSAAKESGKVSDELMKNAGSFEATLQNGWLTSDIIVTVLRDYADATNAVSESTEEMNQKLKKFQDIVSDVWLGKYKNGQERVEALTKAGYDYAEVQELVNKTINGHKLTLEDLNLTQAKALGFTDDEIAMLNELADAAEKAGTPINELIASLSKPSGRELFLDSFANILKGLLKVINTVKGAWSSIFKIDPFMVYNLIDGFHNFTESLIMSDETAGKFNRTLKGLFALLDIIRRIIMTPFVKAFNIFRNALKNVNIPILNVTSNIGDSILAFRDWIIETDAVNTALDVMGAMFMLGVEKIESLIEEFKNLPIVKRSIDFVEDKINSLRNFFIRTFGDMMERISQFIKRIKEFDGINLNNVKLIFEDFKKNVIDPTFDFRETSDKVEESFDNLGESVGENVNSIGNAFNTLTNGIKSFLSLIQSVISDNIGLADVMTVLMGLGTIKGLTQLASAIGSITAPIGSFTNTLKSLGSAFSNLAKSFKADVLIKQATAIAILAGSVALLSVLDENGVLVGVGAIVALAAALAALNFAMNKMGSAGGSIKVAALLLSFSVSITLLIGSLAALNALDMNKTKKSMWTLSILIAEMVAVSYALSKNSKKFIKNTSGILMFTVAIRVLVEALEEVNKMDDNHIWTSITVLGGIMAGLFAFMELTSRHQVVLGSGQRLASGNLLSFAAGILILSISLKAIIRSIESIAKLDTSNITDNIENFVYVVGLLGGLLAIQKFGGSGLSGLGILSMIVGIKLLISVFKQLASIDANTIDQASDTITQVLFVFGLVVAASNFAGQYAIRAGAMMLLMSGSLVMLTGVITVLSHLDGSKLQNAVNAINQLMVVFGLIVALSGLSKDASATILQISIAVAVMGTAIASLTWIDQEKLKSATLALSGIMAVFSIMMLTLGMLKFDDSLFSPLLMITLWTGVIGAMLYALGTMNTKDAMMAAIGIGSLMLALSGTLLMMTKVGDITIGAFTSLTKVILLTILIGSFIGLLSSITDGERAIHIATSISELMVVLTGVTAALGYIGRSGIGIWAEAGALAFDKVLVLVGGVLAVLIGVAGYLATNFPVINDFADSGIALLEKIFYGLGSILGSIVGGFGAGATAGLPEMGTNLTLFMENLTGFMDKIQTVDSTSIANFVNLVDAINTVNKLEMDTKKVKKFGEVMPGFADAIRSFGSAIGNDTINIEAIKMAAEAGAALTTMADSIPNQGGLVSLLAGDNTVSKWSKQLPAFGEAMVSFSDSVANLNEESVTKAANAASMLVELSKEIPNQGGILKFLVGDNTIDKWSKQLPAFGEAMVSFGETIANLKTDAITSSKYAIDMLIELSREIPNQGGIFDMLFGSSNFETFGKNLKSFGESLGSFYESVKGVDSEIMFGAALLTYGFVKIAEGVADIETKGDVTIRSFGYMLSSFGSSYKEYYDKTKRINMEVMLSTTAALGGLIGAMKLLEGVDPKTVEAFGVAMSQLGSSLNSAFTKSIESASGMVGQSAIQLLTAFAMAVRVNTFIAVEAFNQFANTCLVALNIHQTNFATTGVTFAEKIIEGFKSKTTVMTDTSIKLIGDALTAIKKKHGEFVTAGDYLAQGVADGLSSSAAIQRICDAARALVRAAIEAAEEEADINSPSRVMMQDGLYMAEGFGNGMVKGIRIVSGSARKMSKSAIDVVSESVNRLSDLITKDIDTTPVIRPILDLSGARKEALKLNSLFIEDQALKINSSVNRNKTSPVENQNGEKKESTVEQFNFTQNNYSPKALSRKEIYRQTRNQFAMAKGVVSRT